MKRNKHRRANAAAARTNAAIDRVLDDLEDKYCAQVVDAVDFSRLDVIEQKLIDELQLLIARGTLPAPPDRRALEFRASSMINWALSMAASDPRRSKIEIVVEDDNCDLCRAFGTGREHAS